MGGAALRQRESIPALEIPRLSTGEIDTFYREGFLIIRSVFSQGEVLRIAGALDRLYETAIQLGRTTLHRGTQFVVGETERGAPRVDRVCWVGGAEPILSEYGADPRLTSLAGQILRTQDLVQIINQAHYKRPGDGVAFDWHQDCAHRRHGTPEWTDVNGDGSFVETILAIDPMASDNGPLLLIPGSCERGPLPHSPQTRTLLDGVFSPDAAIPALLSPGDVLLVGPYTIHSSLPNEGAHSRRCFLNGFTVPGANRREYPGCGRGRSLEAPALP